MSTYSKDHMYKLCQEHEKKYVLIETTNGDQIEGVILDLDDDHVYLVIPEHTGFDQSSFRQFGSPYPYGYGYNPYGYGYGYPPGPARLRRLILPLTAIAALSLIPW